MTWTQDTILITGGTSGIGRALARELHARGNTELGAERRSDPTASHGGMPVAEFVAAAMAGLDGGEDEVLVGFAAQSRAHPDQVYARLNGRS